MQPWLAPQYNFSTDCIYADLPNIEPPLTHQQLNKRPHLIQYVWQV